MKKKTIIRIGLLLIAVGIAVCVLLYSKLFGSATAFTGESVILEISTGSTYPDLREQLLREQIISSGSVFDWASKLKKFGSQIKPGRYKVKRGASYNGIINMIRSGDQVPVRLEIPACRTLAHLAGILGKQLEADSSRYAEFLLDPNIADSCGLKPETMPSLFMADTYECWWNTSPADFLNRMRREHDRYWTDDNKQKAQKLELTEEEISTLASIVQGETARLDEAPKIAGLYLNRLRTGMRLQADPTVAFALQLDVPRLTFADYQFPSPYNTYLIDGLPPGPIALVNRHFLDAVLNADTHDYIYMCAKPDLSGYHNFTASYNQHLQNADAYRKAIQ